MIFIQEIKSRRDKSGHLRKWAIFFCENCEQYVERNLDGGKRSESCGCSNKCGFGGKKHTEQYRQRMSILMKEKQKDHSGENNPMYGKKQSEEAKQKIRESREKYKGEKASGWDGGKSFEIYPQEFNKELKQFILERDEYTCQDPNCDGNHKRLHVHHIDYDKKNNNPENLITLCISCHMKTNPKTKREFYTKYYYEIVGVYI